jgi:hypothetical protein
METPFTAQYGHWGVGSVINELTAGTKTFLSTFWEDTVCADVTAEHISQSLKVAAAALHYPTNKGIPIQATPN